MPWRIHRRSFVKRRNYRSARNFGKIFFFIVWSNVLIFQRPFFAAFLVHWLVMKKLPFILWLLLDLKLLVILWIFFSLFVGLLINNESARIFEWLLMVGWWLHLLLILRFAIVVFVFFYHFFFFILRILELLSLTNYEGSTARLQGFIRQEKTGSFL